MARHEEQALWAFAKGELNLVEQERVTAHLAECIPCTCAYEDVKGALSVLQPEAPPLSAAQWRAIDDKVMTAAADAVLRTSSFGERWRAFWASARRPLLAGAAGLAVVAVSLYAGYRFGRTGEAPPQPAVAVPSPAPAPAPEPARPVERPAALAAAQVDFARGASMQGQRLRKGTVLSPGAQLATDARGEAWLALPDGSRAGLLGGADARLVSLDAHKVRVQLQKGTLMVSAAHVEGRTFTVAAGKTEIRVLGTRFLVEQAGGQTLIAVEEGQVEVAHGRSVLKVPQGRALTIARNGRVGQRPLQKKEKQQFSELMPDLEPAQDLSTAAPSPLAAVEKAHPPPPAAGGLLPRLKAAPESREGKAPSSLPAAATLDRRPAPASEPEALSAPTPVGPGEPAQAGAADVKPASALAEEEAQAPEPAKPAQAAQAAAPAPDRELFQGSPDEWAQLPQNGAPAQNGAAPAAESWNAFPGDTSARPAAKVRQARPLEKEISAVEEYWVSQMERMAAEGRCRDVLYRASDWMREVLQDARGGERPNTSLYHRVVLAKIRCLEHEGQLEEARKQRQLLMDAPP